MHNCIFTPHCTELVCDRSCPMYVETSYLLERNGITMDSNVFKATDSMIAQATKILGTFASTTGGVVVESSNTDTIAVAELLTYCAICQNWSGSGLHCTVYNLRFSRFLEEMKKSWSNKDTEVFEYMQIWADTAKVLIISNLDFVNFKDFESQTLLNLIQNRMTNKLTTIIVSPPAKSLLSNHGMFFNLIVSRWLQGNEAKYIRYEDGGGIR